jgi:hypothetical protein
MTEAEGIEQDIEIAIHNVWVARTNLEDYEEELERLNAKLYKLQFGEEHDQ